MGETSVQKGIPEGVMDTYCWIHSTFTLPKHGGAGEGEAHPGVRPAPAPGYTEEAVQHRFYQWVCFTLFLQVRLVSRRWPRLCAGFVFPGSLPAVEAAGGRPGGKTDPPGRPLPQPARPADAGVGSHQSWQLPS